MHKNIVTIVVPIYKVKPNKFEEISFYQMSKVLINYKFSLITYKDLEIKYYTKILLNNGNHFEIIYFNKEYFNDINGYNRLLKLKDFYFSFKNFEYILISQLDVYIFKDELIEWCDKNFDYIGSPLFYINKKSIIKSIDIYNGGVSLRKVNSFLKLYFLNCNNFIFTTFKDKVFRYWMYSTKPNILKIAARLLGIKNTYYYCYKQSNEDYFWSILGKKRLNFKLPKFEESIKFAIEKDPKEAMKFIEELPFACHAWQRYDLEYLNNLISQNKFKYKEIER